MTIAFRYKDLTTGTSHVGAGAVTGEARGNIGLGAPYGRVMAIEVKGDDADVDTNASLALEDAHGRKIVAGITLDAGATTFDEYTSQEAIIGGLTSTVGYLIKIGYPEDQAYNSEGDAAADTEGHSDSGVFAKSPVLATLTAGTDGDVHRVGLWVEI
jgi:hypothetical protein